MVLQHAVALLPSISIIEMLELFPVLQGYVNFTLL